MIADLQPYTSPEHQPFSLGESQSGALLIHGFPGTPAEMRPLAEILFNLGWQVRAPLLPGFGPDIANLNRRRQSDWISTTQQEWLALHADCQNCLLVGYSMGAALALHIASAIKPERLVLISPFWRIAGIIPHLVPVARRLAPNLRLFKNADFNDPRLRRMFATILPDADLDDPEVQNFIRTRFTLPISAMEEVLHLGRQAYRLASSIHAEGLVVQGKNDPLIRPEDTQRLIRQLGEQRTTYLEIDAGHDLLASGTLQFEQLAKAVTGFVGPGDSLLAAPTAIHLHSPSEHHRP